MGFVTVYMKNIKEYDSKDLEHLLSMVSPARREIALRKKDEKDQIRSCVCEILLWKGLTELGLDIEELAVSYEEKKPRLYDRFAKVMVEKTGMDPSAMNVGLDFSFSHSKEHIKCKFFISSSHHKPAGIDDKEAQYKCYKYA